MVILIIKYYKLRENRYLRGLEVEGNKTLFVNSFLNLEVLNNIRKEDLKKDFEMCKNIIKKQIKVIQN